MENVKIFTNMEEMRLYYNKRDNAYIFQENGRLFSILILIENFKSNISIKAKNIKAKNIECENITANDIEASDIFVKNTIKCNNITARIVRSEILEAYSAVAKSVDCTHIYITKEIEAENRIGCYRIEAKDIYSDILSAHVAKADYINVNLFYAANVEGGTVKIDKLKAVSYYKRIDINVKQFIIRELLQNCKDEYGF